MDERKVSTYDNYGEITFSWSKKDFGFGVLTVVFDDGEVRIENEGMGKATVRDLLHAWVDDVVDEWEPEIG